MSFDICDMVIALLLGRAGAPQSLKRHCTSVYNGFRLHAICSDFTFTFEHVQQGGERMERAGVP